MTVRPGATSGRKILVLSRHSGCSFRRVGTLRQALVSAAGGTAVGPEDVVAAALAAMTDDERQVLQDQARDRARKEAMADASWVWWGELGRKLAPKVIEREGPKGVSLVCEAAKEPRAYSFVLSAATVRM